MPNRLARNGRGESLAVPAAKDLCKRAAEAYSASFYDRTTGGSLRAARMVLPLLRRLRAFDSVADLGCGVGTWLLAAQELGAKNVRGVEGAHAPQSMLLIDPSCVEIHDLDKGVGLSGSYDLCLCLEVAEHLLPASAERLVAGMCSLSDLVAFSAAIPFQGGDLHLNEMWPEFWARLFARHDFHPWSGIRREIWHRREIPWWYRQNLIVFIHTRSWESLLPGQTPDALDSLTMIHPECYLWNVRRTPRLLQTGFEEDINLFYECAAGMPMVPPGYGPEFPAPQSEEGGCGA